MVSGVKATGDEDDSDADEAAGGDASVKGKCLTVEQVQVLDAEGHVKVVYPSRVDLVSDSFRVIRESV